MKLWFSGGFYVQYNEHSDTIEDGESFSGRMTLTFSRYAFTPACMKLCECVCVCVCVGVSVCICVSVCVCVCGCV